MLLLQRLLQSQQSPEPRKGQARMSFLLFEGITLILQTAFYTHLGMEISSAGALLAKGAQELGFCSTLVLSPALGRCKRSPGITQVGLRCSHTSPITHLGKIPLPSVGFPGRKPPLGCTPSIADPVVMPKPCVCSPEIVRNTFKTG